MIFFLIRWVRFYQKENICLLFLCGVWDWERKRYLLEFVGHKRYSHHHLSIDLRASLYVYKRCITLLSWKWIPSNNYIIYYINCVHLVSIFIERGELQGWMRVERCLTWRKSIKFCKKTNQVTDHFKSLFFQLTLQSWHDVSDQVPKILTLLSLQKLLTHFA